MSTEGEKLIQALKDAREWLEDERRKWWPFKPPWTRPKKPGPKKPAGGAAKKIKEKEPA